MSGKDETGESGAVLPVVYWDNDDMDVHIDDRWLVEELAATALFFGESVYLTFEEYEREREALRRKLIVEPRLRACLRTVKTGKPSTPKKFQGLATYTASWFKEALRRKSLRKKNSGVDTYMGAHETNEKPVACKRDHARERVRGSELWYCPDACGWTERLPEGMRRRR